ncbi:Trehalose transport system permease protein SugA [Caloramator mitchellensis]|uniref:Trehalose transport system permease protein SugA n=1 Tax=Caloramator mitchellensis TaxID=908809 RepID=A0A0R3K323_CALMK|nr:sugar ABC transporter permease [Caloramator mitchellensis]KRQ86719.1 Trehalose transport system permease protein SugA [Caloramator mitchellensis]
MKFLKKNAFEIILILPLALYILGFTILPIFKTILLSFQDKDTGAIGITTYQYLFAKKDFRMAIFNTIAVTFVGLTFQLVVGLFIAMALKYEFRGKGLVRSLVLLPMGVPTLVSGVTLLYIFGTQGYLNKLLYTLGIISKPIAWTSGGIKNIFVIAIADSWKVLPVVVLLLLAGLESIPSEVYEASAIDGASKTQTFFSVTLPLLKPSITMTMILRAVDSFRIFELPKILAGRVTPFLATYAYDEYSYNNLNASAASSTILLLIIIIFMFLYFRIVDRGEGVRHGK